MHSTALAMRKRGPMKFVLTRIACWASMNTSEGKRNGGECRGEARRGEGKGQRLNASHGVNERGGE